MSVVRTISSLVQLLGPISRLPNVILTAAAADVRKWRGCDLPSCVDEFVCLACDAKYFLVESASEKRGSCFELSGIPVMTFLSKELTLYLLAQR